MRIKDYRRTTGLRGRYGKSSGLFFKGPGSYLGHPSEAVSLEIEPIPVTTLSKALSDPAPETRYQAALGLCQLGANSQLALPALTSAIGDTNDLVRNAAIRALGAIGAGANNVIPSLQKLLGSESSATRSAAHEAIDKILDSQHSEP